jgi:hypothetical protein
MVGLVRAPEARFDLRQPAEAVGATGAAVVPVMLAVAAAKGCAPGPRLRGLVGDNGGARASPALGYSV